jgi:hypothetical protein
MKNDTVRAIVSVAAYTGLALDAATLAIVVPAWMGHPLTSALVTAVATVVMIATLALQLAFIIVQMIPGGRAMVAVPGLGYDGWFFAIVSTVLPGVLWSNLAAQAAPFMRLIMPGFTTPAMIALLLMVGRGVQQRRLRAARSGITTL